MKYRIAIMASGEGTNAQNIIEYFRDHALAKVVLVATNKPQAGVISRANNLDVETLVFDKTVMMDPTGLLAELKSRSIDYVVLAGFLMKIPDHIIQAYPERMINIHPALLPKYGGKGMYGMHVHRAVKANDENETGISVHLVNEQYDQGGILFQAKTAITKEDSPEDIAAKVHQLEYRHYPEVIEQVILNTAQVHHG